MLPIRQLVAAASLALGALLAFIIPGLGSAGPIRVEVSGLRSDRGVVLGALFASPRGWTEEGREIATCRGTIAHNHATCIVEGVGPGTYAFAFLHDEDEDGHLDRDWIGIPQEGYGFSNNASPGLGPPSFESASFEHGTGETVLRVRTRYGI